LKPAPAPRAIGEVRIIGGTLKRSKLKILDRPGLRPTPDRIRETVFNWLAPTIDGARVLDVCAGTGALGLEAVSRGAAHAHLNDADADLARQIVADAQRLKIAERVQVSNRRAEALLTEAPTGRFDIVFLDPPFDADLWARLLFRLPPWLAPGALVYLEHPREIAAPFGGNWTVHKQAQAGRIAFYLLELQTASVSSPAQPEPSA
jgi:16S rRNA (guanine966-N2)-methyltransferase